MVLGPSSVSMSSSSSSDEEEDDDEAFSDFYCLFFDYSYSSILNSSSIENCSSSSDYYSFFSIFFIKPASISAFTFGVYSDQSTAGSASGTGLTIDLVFGASLEPTGISFYYFYGTGEGS